MERQGTGVGFGAVERVLFVDFAGAGASDR